MSQIRLTKHYYATSKDTELPSVRHSHPFGIPGLSAMVRPAGSTDPRLFWRVAAKDVDSDANGLNDWEQAQISAYVEITSSAGSNGSISPSGTLFRAKGGSVAFTITPTPDYLVDTVLVDGADVGAVSSYTFNDLQVPHTIAASFRSAGLFEASPNTIDLPQAGSSENVSMSASGAWAAASSASWLTVSPSSGPGSATFLLTAPANTSLARTATIYLQSGGLSRQITVTQRQGPTFAIRNRGQGTYMCDAGDRVGYGATIADSTHLWFLEDTGNGHKEIRNFGTGDHIHIEDLPGWAQCTPRTPGWWSSQWSQENAGAYVLFRNRWESSNYLHVENLTGDVEQTPIDTNLWSAQWELIETP